LSAGTPYVDAGVASASDACAGALTATLASNNVDFTTPGDYAVVYEATDGTNTASKTRVVHVVDASAPIISLAGNASVVVECHDTYSDAGATAADACEGDITNSIAIASNVDAEHGG
jgi:hypothetical protein